MILFFYLIYPLAINFATFLLFAIDKHRAIKGEWRISEATLLVFCAFGGSIGGLVGMYVCHHKTKKNKFRIGVPAILILQFAALVFLYLQGK